MHVLIYDQLATTSQNHTLKDVSDELVHAGRFLGDIASDPHRVECLRAFGSYGLAVLGWLKEATRSKLCDKVYSYTYFSATIPTGPGDLQNFVNVALTTGAEEEGEFACDKLANLSTVGNFFAPLIYQLSRRTNYHELCRACLQVWRQLKDNPGILTLLVSGPNCRAILCTLLQTDDRETTFSKCLLKGSCEH